MSVRDERDSNSDLRHCCSSEVGYGWRRARSISCAQVAVAVGPGKNPDPGQSLWPQSYPCPPSDSHFVGSQNCHHKHLEKRRLAAMIVKGTPKPSSDCGLLWDHASFRHILDPRIDSPTQLCTLWIFLCRAVCCIKPCNHPPSSCLLACHCPYWPCICARLPFNPPAQPCHALWGAVFLSVYSPQGCTTLRVVPSLLGHSALQFRMDCLGVDSWWRVCSLF